MPADGFVRRICHRAEDLRLRIQVRGGQGLLRGGPVHQGLYPILRPAEHHEGHGQRRRVALPDGHERVLQQELRYGAQQFPQVLSVVPQRRVHRTGALLLGPVAVQADARPQARPVEHRGGDGRVPDLPRPLPLHHPEGPDAGDDFRPAGQTGGKGVHVRQTVLRPGHLPAEQPLRRQQLRGLCGDGTKRPARLSLRLA